MLYNLYLAHIQNNYFFLPLNMGYIFLQTEEVKKDALTNHLLATRGQYGN